MASGWEPHAALIDLSRSEQGIRLITTNFDDRFVEAGLDRELVDAAPKLPVPKPHTWRSLVHLHGRIAPNEDGSNLVLTAADFGRAYLTEQWAARFVTELFREFTVVFAGYSVGDPVMSYMVDALAAERTMGARFEAADNGYRLRPRPEARETRKGLSADASCPGCRRSRVDNGLVAARLLAGATTSPLPRGSNNSYNTPGAQPPTACLVRAAIRLSTYGLTARNGMRTTLGTRQISHPIATESAGSSCCPQEKTPATAAFQYGSGARWMSVDGNF